MNSENNKTSDPHRHTKTCANQTRTNFLIRKSGRLTK